VPSAVGELCAVLCVKAPPLSGKVGEFDLKKSNVLARINSQICLKFRLPSEYPSSAAPQIQLDIGDLSSFEFDGKSKRSLIEKVVHR
jgi:hypothetical protein